MREILFRGKQTGGNEWAEGCLIHTQKYCCILQEEEKVHPMDYPYLDNDTGCFDGHATPVMPDTVGQYSGRIDKNNVKMFEGDIVAGLFLHSMPVNGVVSFRDGSFGLLWDRAGSETFTPFTSMCNVEYEVIGNIHDNPELLKGGDE